MDVAAALTRSYRLNWKMGMKTAVCLRFLRIFLKQQVGSQHIDGGSVPSISMASRGALVCTRNVSFSPFFLFFFLFFSLSLIGSLAC